MVRASAKEGRRDMARGSVNQVVLVGNLGSDPDVRFTPSGTQVTTASLATDETWTDRNGKTQHRAEWHRLVLWGRLAEIARQYWRRGARVHVEGRLQTRSWEDDRGQRHFVTEVVATNMHMPDGEGGPGELDLKYREETGGELALASGDSPWRSNTSSSRDVADSPSLFEGHGGGVDGEDDGLPF